ncbi:hypothetical protein JMJ55_04625 [Belnapia sp. T6]|uniref:Uncharacterized protein n=1 Tax=Belnapia mucosa TaxID=2804532 RepID=A0ABS1V2T2_9PROT|nr:hypothetical protein [Belnapia mucosa]MBL6454598.1 hypothetical protein [Belnapia mucosa]
MDVVASQVLTLPTPPRRAIDTDPDEFDAATRLIIAEVRAMTRTQANGPVPALLVAAGRALSEIAEAAMFERDEVWTDTGDDPGTLVIDLCEGMCWSLMALSGGVQSLTEIAERLGGAPGDWMCFSGATLGALIAPRHRPGALVPQHPSRHPMYSEH